MKPLPTFESRVMPVIVLTHVNQAMKLAEALWSGGIDVMEITLRHPAGLSCIREIAQFMPQMKVGAGTVLSADDLNRVQEAGAQFALSPGCTDDIRQRASELDIPFIPGVMTPSEVLAQASQGVSVMKLFPAAQAGGIAMLKSLYGPMPHVRFCPTGGVQLSNLAEFLALPNVPFVGGTWICPPNLIESGDFSRIRTLAAEATALAQQTTHQ